MKRQLTRRRPSGPAPVVPDAVVPVQRRVSSRGALMVAGQKIPIGNSHAGATVDVHPTDTTWRVYDGDQLLTEVPRISSKPIARLKARKAEPPRHVPSSVVPIPRTGNPANVTASDCLSDDPDGTDH
jgi:hypothetical protein